MVFPMTDQWIRRQSDRALSQVIDGRSLLAQVIQSITVNKWIYCWYWTWLRNLCFLPRERREPTSYGKHRELLKVILKLPVAARSCFFTLQMLHSFGRSNFWGVSILLPVFWLCGYLHWAVKQCYRLKPPDKLVMCAVLWHSVSGL